MVQYNQRPLQRMSFQSLHTSSNLRPLLPATDIKEDIQTLELKIMNSMSLPVLEHNLLSSNSTHVTINQCARGLALTVRPSDSATSREYKINYQKSEKAGMILPKEEVADADCTENVLPELEESTESGDASDSICGDGYRENRRFLYDIDLQAPSFKLENQEECLEEEDLTPTLTDDSLKEWQILPDLSHDSRDSGIDTFCYSFEAGSSYTGIISRLSTEVFSGNNSSDDTPNKHSPGPRGDDLDEPENFQCVSYSDIHMEPPPPSPLIDLPQTQTVEVKAEPKIEELPSDSAKKEKEKAPHENKSLKRPKNGFIRFAMQYRRKIAEDHPRMDNREISRILGVRWRKLSQEEKKTYELEFQKEMCERKREHPDWRYGGVRQYVDQSACEPIPSRLRPRQTLKRKKIPKLTRPYKRRGKNAVVQLTWVQCDQCDKWRQLPYGIDEKNIPEKWYCEYNWPPKNYCDAEEDQEDPEEKDLTEHYAIYLNRDKSIDLYSTNDFVTF